MFLPKAVGGAILIVALVALAIISTLTLSSFGHKLTDLRAVKNTQQRLLARTNAEAILKEAESALSEAFSANHTINQLLAQIPTSQQNGYQIKYLGVNNLQHGFRITAVGEAGNGVMQSVRSYLVGTLGGSLQRTGWTMVGA